MVIEMRLDIPQREPKKPDNDRPYRHLSYRNFLELLLLPDFFDGLLIMGYKLAL